MAAARQRLLLVDDSAEDRFLITQALNDAGLDCHIDEACDGVEAELYMQQNMSAGNLPQTVILDLRLPKRSGKELMEKLFATGMTKKTCVIVLSSVLTESEIANLRKLGAAAVFEKPLDLDQFAALGKSVRQLMSLDGFTSQQAS